MPVEKEVYREANDMERLKVIVDFIGGEIWQKLSYVLFARKL